MSPLTRIFPQTTIDKRQKKLIITQFRDTDNIGHKTQNKTSKTNKHNTETEKQLQNGRHKKTKTKNKNKTKQKHNTMCVGHHNTQANKNNINQK